MFYIHVTDPDEFGVPAVVIIFRRFGSDIVNIYIISLYTRDRLRMLFIFDGTFFFFFLISTVPVFAIHRILQHNLIVDAHLVNKLR